MKQQNDAFVGVRLPKSLRSFLENKQKVMSRRARAEVKLSAVIRSILEEAAARDGRKSRQQEITAA